MDINCNYNCKHQKNGKCFLMELTNTTVQQVDIDNKVDIDCAYYESINI